MADNAIFPGTEMAVFEKYPGSRRLDHPNFGDVAKTTYAKGVIMDFQKTNDAPLQVASKVKVDIEGVGESDFLPLFFHPKKLYWDDVNDPTIQATDYDEEKGLYKRAWMSFRCGDEVAVMINSGSPVAVFGFTDGKPKIGEDIIKIEDSQNTYTSYFSMSSGVGHPGISSTEVGLDGLPLNLSEVGPKYYGGIETIGSSVWYESCSGGSYQYGVHNEYAETDAQYVRNTSTTEAKLTLWIAKVGPILYAFIQVSTRGSGTRGLYLYHSTTYEPGINDWDAQNRATHTCSEPPFAGTLYGTLDSGSSDWSPSVGAAMAGIYSDKLLEAVIQSFQSLSAADVYHSIGMGSLWPNPPDGLINQGWGGIIPSIDPSRIDLKYRPHQEAS